MRWSTANDRRKHKLALRYNVLRKYGAVAWDRKGNYRPLPFIPTGIPGVGIWLHGQSNVADRSHTDAQRASYIADLTAMAQDWALRT